MQENPRLPRSQSRPNAHSPTATRLEDGLLIPVREAAVTRG